MRSKLPLSHRGHSLRVVGLAVVVSSLALGTGVPAGAITHGSQSGPPTVYAKAWVLADATTGEVLAAKNAHLAMRPASTLKTLTALTLLPRLDKKAVYRANYDDAAVVGSAVGIVPGGTYTIDQLFYGMMLPSGNDAAHALASANGGMKRTVKLMRAEATHLQAYDTTLRNDSGLDAKGEFTSAYDLSLFARAGMQRADFRRYVATTSYSFPGRMPKKGHKRDTFMIYNQNPLLINYRGAVGVKTGYTTLAGRTFVGAAERHGHLLIVSLMGVIEPSETAAARLLNWGFSNTGSVAPVGRLAAPIAVGSEANPSTSQLPGSDRVSMSAQTVQSAGFDFWLLGAVLALMAFGIVSIAAVRRGRRRPRDRMSRRSFEKVPFRFKD